MIKKKKKKQLFKNIFFEKMDRNKNRECRIKQIVKILQNNGWRLKN